VAVPVDLKKVRLEIVSKTCAKSPAGNQSETAEKTDQKALVRSFCVPAKKAGVDLD
jgi:hypothetical protein